MCRLIAYKGPPLLLDDLLYKPRNSLIHQSYDARELEEPLNGDGFGLGWYNPALASEPAVFVSMTPAWSNRNLKSLAAKIESGLVFAHVRAASVGEIAEANCHPFQRGDWMFMHNGGIEDFPAIRRDLRGLLSDNSYAAVRGQTDSEHFFGLVHDRLTAVAVPTPEDAAAAVEAAIRTVTELKKKRGVAAETYLNTVLSNGRFMVATRYCSDPKIEALSLYYSAGTRYICKDGVCEMIETGPDGHAVLVVSERLTDLREDWRKVPPNHFVMVAADGTVTLRPIAA